MGRCLIYEALNKANKNRNMYSVEFCFLTGLVAAAGSEGDFWWLRGPQETQARVAIKPLWVVFLTISKGPWASSSWFQALLSAPPAADLIGFSVQGQPEPAHSLAWNPSPSPWFSPQFHTGSCEWYVPKAFSWSVLRSISLVHSSIFSVTVAFFSRAQEEKAIANCDLRSQELQSWWAWAEHLKLLEHLPLNSKSPMSGEVGHEMS